MSQKHTFDSIYGKSGEMEGLEKLKFQKLQNLDDDRSRIKLPKDFLPSVSSPARYSPSPE
jgi:hypothetical protein